MGPGRRCGIAANTGPDVTGASQRAWSRPYHGLVDALGSVLIVVAAIVGAWLLLVALIWLHRPSRDLAVPALRALPDIVRLARRLLADPRTPLSHRIGLVVLIVWLVSPIDLLPEFLPGIGPLDDIVAAAVILGWVARGTGRARLEELWPGDAAGFSVVARMLRLPAE